MSDSLKANQHFALAARRPKRKATATKDGTSKSVAKRVKIPNDKRKETRSQVHRSEVINKPPTDVLTVLVFGDGENAELGLGPNKTESKVPRVNPFLDPNDRSKFHIVHLACGGMHTVALTADGQIITWGVNDGAALGRDTAWDGDLRDMDSESDDEVGDLNPLESTPTAVSPEHFEPGVRFAQVAAGDNCTFALTTTGLVYGWGTFRVSKVLNEVVSPIITRNRMHRVTSVFVITLAVVL
jgi:regulator of chromosome condensation